MREMRQDIIYFALGSQLAASSENRNRRLYLILLVEREKTVLGERWSSRLGIRNESQVQRHSVDFSNVYPPPHVNKTSA